MVNTKFLGLPIDNKLNWKNHIEKMITNLSRACYAIRLIVHNTLKSIYYAYFHSAIKYGRLDWCNSSNSEKIFTLHKKKMSSELRLEHNPDPLEEVYLNN